MTIYIVDYEEDVVDSITLPDGRYTDEDLTDLYGVFYYTRKEAKVVLDDYAKQH